MNLGAREIALDVAASACGMEAMSWGHIAGCLNDWADALSRLEAPEPKLIPEALLKVPRAELAVRGWTWWPARV